MKDEMFNYLLLDLGRDRIMEIQRLATADDLTVDEWMNKVIKEGIERLSKELSAKKKKKK